MEVGMSYSGMPSIGSKKLDFSSKDLNSDERSTLNRIASLQGEEFSKTVTRYKINKHLGIDHGIAFKDGRTVIQNIDGFIKALANQAKDMGGTDRYGVTEQEYKELGLIKGLFIDEQA